MREIAKSLTYEDKRRISILRRNLDFRNTRDLRVLDKYSSLISDWETFRKGLHLTLDKHIVCCDPLKKVILNIVNYVVCKSVIGHLLFCKEYLKDKINVVNVRK